MILAKIVVIALATLLAVQVLRGTVWHPLWWLGTNVDVQLKKSPLLFCMLAACKAAALSWMWLSVTNG